MDEISAFPPNELFFFALVGVGYFLCAYAPVLYSGFVAIRRGPEMSRRLLFVMVVAALSYGAVAFAGFALNIPITAYVVYVAPQLEASGHFYGQRFTSVGAFVTRYWWLGQGPALLVVSICITRYLLRRWPRIVEALSG